MLEKEFKKYVTHFLGKDTSFQNPSKRSLSKSEE